LIKATISASVYWEISLLTKIASEKVTEWVIDVVDCPVDALTCESVAPFVTGADELEEVGRPEASGVSLPDDSMAGK
jgi:hypothetical protein